MKTLNKKTTKTLEKIIEGMAPFTSKKIGEGGAYMALHVERLSETDYSLAHYYEQNGDLMADPDMVFRKTDAGFVPQEITQAPMGIYRETCTFDENGEIDAYSPAAVRELCSFASMWLENIKGQQDL